jgi:hypothetical protein
MNKAEGISASRISSSYQELSTSAVELNAATSRLTKTIEIVDEALKKLNLGISSWVEIGGASFEDEGLWETEYLGYSKVNSKWGLAFRVTSGNYRYPDQDTSRESLLGDAPREARIKSLSHLPALLQQLIKDAKAAAAKINERLDEAEKLARALSNGVDPDSLRLETAGGKK